MCMGFQSLSDEAVMTEPLNVAPTREVWMDESLVYEARRLWERMIAGLSKRKSSWTGKASGSCLG